jgi:SAM-dependent methyltransferase
LKEKARTVVVDDAGGGEPPMLEEPLVVSAPLARRVAPDLCRKDPASGEDCAWYHGPWQYFRVLDLVTAPPDHADFLLDALGSLARADGYRRILVSGAADYSMPAHVLWAYAKGSAVADVTVVDICETPLFLTKWYAETRSARLQTQACDILDYETERSFDVLCTHSFLGNFAADQRRDVIAKWRDLLRPGGKVITVNRVRPANAPEKVRFTREQAAEFREAVLREARVRRDILGVDPEELASCAQTYAESKRTHPIKSREEIIELFEGGGFAIERFELGGVPGKFGKRPSGPTAPGDAEYARIVASRL